MIQSVRHAPSGCVAFVAVLLRDGGDLGTRDDATLPPGPAQSGLPRERANGGQLSEDPTGEGTQRVARVVPGRPGRS